MFGFIRDNDKKGYASLNDKQLRAHLWASLAHNQLRARIECDGAVSAVCTYGFDHARKLIQVYGLVGDLDFVRFMRRSWHAYFPFYNVFFYRNGVERHYKHNLDFKRN